MEHNLKGLRWLCATGLLDARIDLLDTGLTDTGRERVDRLLQTESSLHLYESNH